MSCGVLAVKVGLGGGKLRAIRVRNTDDRRKTGATYNARLASYAPYVMSNRHFNMVALTIKDNIDDKYIA